MRIYTKWQKLLFIGVLFTFYTPTFGQKIYISEVFYDSPISEENDTHNGEFIELYNPSSGSVNLKGWSLSGYFPKEIYTFSSITLPSKSYLIVAYKQATSGFIISSLFPELLEYESSDRILYQNAIRLSNRGETIILKDGNSNIVDSMSYYGIGNGISTPTVADGEKKLYARNGLQSYKSAYSCLSLYRASVTRDESGNAIFKISNWGHKTVTPLGVTVSMSGYESLNSFTSEDVEYFPEYNYANSSSIEIPEIEDQETITKLDGDIVYSYDNNGNRMERTIYLSSTKKATVKTTTPNIENDSIQNTDKDIHIYPNPTKGELKLSISSSIDYTLGKIYVYDTNSRLIISTTITSHSFSIDLNNYPTGIYVMRVVLDKKIYVWKIVKE